MRAQGFQIVHLQAEMLLVAMRHEFRFDIAMHFLAIHASLEPDDIAQ